MTAKVRVLRSIAYLGVAGFVFASLGAQSVATLPSSLLPTDARSITGQPISVDPKAGARVVVLDFFTSWCVPCGPEARQLERVQRRLAGKGVLVVGVDVGEDADKAREFAGDNRLTYPIMIDAGRMEKQYRAWAYPLAIVIDQRAGTLQRFEGERVDLEAVIERVVDGRE